MWCSSETAGLPVDQFDNFQKISSSRCNEMGQAPLLMGRYHDQITWSDYMLWYRTKCKRLSWFLCRVYIAVTLHHDIVLGINAVLSESGFCVNSRFTKMVLYMWSCIHCSVRRALKQEVDPPWGMISTSWAVLTHSGFFPDNIFKCIFWNENV